MRGKADNLDACVEKRPHESLSPEPMYLRNDLGHKAVREMNFIYKSPRPKSQTLINDTSNKSGMRGKGGY